ncbi:MAG: GNAT family protein [Pseudomonas sp.]|uniref:GNAT family N-acetyltransferase n=1 Tax=Pseudomonas sp. TaxID=306 RepID=UPI003BB5F11B
MTSNQLQDWQPAQLPAATTLAGHYVRLEQLDPARHGDDLWQALQGAEADPQMWHFMAYGPFASRDDFAQWLDSNAAGCDPLFYAVIDRLSGKALGLLSYLNITPAHGNIEIGHVCFGRAMQRSVQASETIYLLARYAFELGNRRLEWKCDNLNLRSRRAAERFGFSHEGLFRQHLVRKGRNRDTAWFSLLDHEWPAMQGAFERWLAADNFSADGQQRHSLTALRTD